MQIHVVFPTRHIPISHTPSHHSLQLQAAAGDCIQGYYVFISSAFVNRGTKLSLAYLLRCPMHAITEWNECQCSVRPNCCPIEHNEGRENVTKMISAHQECKCIILWTVLALQEGNAQYKLCCLTYRLEETEEGENTAILLHQLAAHEINSHA